MKKNILKYGLCVGFIGITAAIFLLTKDLTDPKTGYRLLCDAFTIPGVLLLCAGALIWVSNQGALDGLSFCLRTALGHLFPGKGEMPGYRQYVEQKHPIRGYGFLPICGGISVAISLIFLGIFYLS